MRLKASVPSVFIVVSQGFQRGSKMLYNIYPSNILCKHSKSVIFLLKLV